MNKGTDSKKSNITVLLCLLVLSVTSLFLCTGIGTVDFSISDILHALFRDGDTPAHLIIWELRFPRLLCCGLVGICLSLSGCILQGVMRNTMASPSTIGVTAGASFVGYLTLVAFPTYAHLLPIGSIIGSFATTILIYLLAYKNGVSPVKLILSGMAVSALFGAFNDSIRTMFSASLGNASGFLVGGFNGCGWDSFRMMLPYALIGVGICLFLPQKMNILMLGDETALSLGLNTEPFRLLLIAVSSLLAGASVATAGLLSFVGLVVPHIARLLVGSDHRYLFPASSMLGFVMLVVCDTAGRVIIPPGEVPVSIILSLVGAPFFLWLLHRREKGGGF